MDLTGKQHNTAAVDRVSFPVLLAFGMGGLIPIALFNIAGQLMGLMGNISMGLSAFWLGVIMIIPRLWDAFTDPMMGHVSDNARTRWGRRRRSAGGRGWRRTSSWRVRPTARSSRAPGTRACRWARTPT